ncbi:Plasmid stabilization system protein [Thiorhodovibrio winogradskyi]|uniref:Plasmid stabilization system protein n=1 Tax=Thiorhodovibrio winogradskyi TaxID=77007 RepID=A0ABZ0S379_9GAMM|nr:type II toxin-antitoxin system RelE/ParE family toxin [Thiorhodovibrio winogradskyi]
MVSWTDHAVRQVRQIHDWIAQDSPIYARRVAEGLVKRTTGLDELPRKGKMVPELNDDSVREIPQYSYRVIYNIKSPDVEILAVIHKRRDAQPHDIYS